MEDSGGERVQGHSIRDVQEQPQHEGHDHSHGQGGLQNSYHEDGQIHHAKEKLSEEALATSFVGGGRLLAVEAASGGNHHGAVEVVDVVGKSGPEASAEVEG